MGCCASQEEVDTIADVPVEAAEVGVTEVEQAKETLAIGEVESVKAKAGNETFVGPWVAAASQEEVDTIADVPVEAAEVGVTEVEQAKETLAIGEVESVKAKAGNETFVGSVLKARAECAEDAAVMEDCATRMQVHNRRLKEYVAIYDCQTVNEAMNGGFLGLGCNDRKLIAALCTRTKNQLQRTRKQYRSMYDKDLRAEVKGETGSGAYGRMVFFALASHDEYVADIIDLACKGFGCDETALLEVFVTHTQEELQAGKKKWEGRTDKHLVDYLKSELGSSYRHLNRLLNLLYMGDRVETDEVDEDLAAKQVNTLQEECDKGWFEDFDESLVIEIIGKNTTAQNQLVAQLFEKQYEVSLAKRLKGKCGDRLYYALNALLLTKEDFVAMRLHDAMKGWFNDKDLLTRLLGGLDGHKMQGVADAFERKYGQPLWSALKAEVSGDFLNAALTWLQSFDEPSRGAEKYTEVEVGELSGDAGKLVEMVDYLLLEHESLLVFVAYLDVETIREAVKGWGTDDTALIRAFATRNKRALARINIGYRQAYGEPMQALIESELGTKGYYSYLAKFLVVQAEQADLMILDLAMDGATVDHAALVEFLCARHPKRVRAAKDKWESFHDDSLVDKLADTLSGDMERLAFKMLKGKRDTDDNGKVDDGLARKQAHQLHDGAIDFIDTLCANSAPQNALCAKYYEESYDTSLRRAISQEYSGPVKNALLALLQGPAEWYAAQLKAALNGHEVNDKSICRILGAHDKDEVKEIASAYERKYNTPLKSAISSGLKGDYKRLAVAWVSLPDQLEQPAKKIDIPSDADIDADAGAFSASAVPETTVDDEISEDDEGFGSDVDPTSQIYQVKVQLWSQKYEKYRDMGKAHKADHYQRLLLLYPPVATGHKILKGYVEALAEEYKKDATGDDWTTLWLDNVDDADFEEAGTRRDLFKKWYDVTESLVAEKKVTIKELKGHWGVADPPPEPRQGGSVYAQPAALTPVAYPTAVPVAQPYGTNYPQAAPPTAYPQAIAYPQAQPQAAPPIYGQPPIYGAAPPIYGQPPIYGGVPAYPGTSTTTTTTTTSYVQAMPAMQPLSMYGTAYPGQPQFVYR
eukprot:CAMPEP_0115866008 /NCGR_PEP_ID=MMETSP0287-20121206/20027_1 /TAXON_ID=412157 /ORGANISM="Chrysochromulina rotalis, Strain UIO044" /LENGTH=1093 /DNA_ID=CAMNT_0003320561 /DNA_START=29 /DNA_END=3309 /DNA_ORIENTATION=-